MVDVAGLDGELVWTDRESVSAGHSGDRVHGHAAIILNENPLQVWRSLHAHHNGIGTVWYRGFPTVHDASEHAATGGRRFRRYFYPRKGFPFSEVVAEDGVESDDGGDFHQSV